MFTGIVETTGTVVKKENIGGDCRLVIETGQLSLAGCGSGDSISVSGACLTMLEPEANRFTADVSQETLSLTTLGGVEAGGKVNLELAMAAEDRFGGHLVTGHVDGMATLLARREDARAVLQQLAMEAALAPCVQMHFLRIVDIDLLYRAQSLREKPVKYDHADFGIQLETAPVEVCGGNDARVAVNADGLRV